MPRLKNSTTGVVVNVSDEKAERMTAGDFSWGSFEEEPKKAPAKKAAAKRSSSNK